MSRVQIYRAELAHRQSHRLWGYLGLAVGLHLLGAATVAFWQPLLLKPQVADPTPLEFVYVDPQTPRKPPSNSPRQAQTNSTAGGTRNPDRPVQSAPRPDSPSNLPLNSPPNSSLNSPAVRSAPSQSAAQSASPAPAPAPPTAESQPPTAIARSTRPVPQPLPSLAAPSPAASSPATSSPARPAPRRAVSNSASNSAAPTAAAAGGATQLGNHSVSLERGGAASLNPDRTAIGAGIDAAQDDVWGGYLAILNRSVELNWSQVSVSATSRTRVQFRVDRQGQLVALQVLERSGNEIADQAAVRAVRAAAPFAPLPQNAPEDLLIVNFTFTQWLNPGAP